jgi:hypothetical protein
MSELHRRSDRMNPKHPVGPPMTLGNMRALRVPSQSHRTDQRVEVPGRYRIPPILFEPWRGHFCNAGDGMHDFVLARYTALADVSLKVPGACNANMVHSMVRNVLDERRGHSNMLGLLRHFAHGFLGHRVCPIAAKEKPQFTNNPKAVLAEAAKLVDAFTKAGPAIASLGASIAALGFAAYIVAQPPKDDDKTKTGTQNAPQGTTAHLQEPIN